MKDKFNFTKAAIEALPHPEQGKRKFYYDTKVPGLALRVYDSGMKVFYMYRWAAGKPQKEKIAPFPAMTVEQARKWMEIRNAEIAQGVDPSVNRAKKRAELTFKELFHWYIENHARANKRSWQRDVQNFNNHLAAPLGAKRVGDIQRTDIRQLHAAVRAKNGGGPYGANRILALVSVVFNLGIAEEVIAGPNPAEGVKPFPEVSRDRCVSEAEMPRLLEAIEAEPNETLRDYIYMLLFTGARRDNVLSMRWEDINFGNATWRIPMTKNGRPEVVPLEDAELALLKRRLAASNGNPWVFPGRRDTKSGHLENPYDGWYRILERADVTDLRLHDLRRTLGSWMADTGASLPIIGKTLHHASAKTTEVYARISSNPVRRAKSRALEAMRSARDGSDFESLGRTDVAG